MRKYDFIYFIGDSFTFGVDQSDDLQKEVTFENRFSQLVANEFNLTLVNHAKAGCSNDFIARTITNDMLDYKKEGLNPLVVVSYTWSNRREIWDNKSHSAQTLQEYMPIWKEYIINHHDKPGYQNYNDVITRYHMASIHHLLKYLDYDFVETWSGDPVYNTQLDTKTVILPNFIHTVLQEGCFRASGSGDGTPDPIQVGSENPLEFPYDHYGHLNVRGNQMISKIIIDKINELYG